MSLNSGASKTTVLQKKTANTRLGLVFVSGNDGVKVSDISPNSLADKSDIQVGDKVLTINGRDVNGMSSSDTASLLRKSTGPVAIVTEVEEEDAASDIEDPLIEPVKEESSMIDDHAIAQSMSGMLGSVILVVQVVAAAVIFLLFSYGKTEDFTTQQYIIFRDIMVMLLLGFGYRKLYFHSKRFESIKLASHLPIGIFVYLIQS